MIHTQTKTQLTVNRILFLFFSFIAPRLPPRRTIPLLPLLFCRKCLAVSFRRTYVIKLIHTLKGTRYRNQTKTWLHWITRDFLCSIHKPKCIKCIIQFETISYYYEWTKAATMALPSISCDKNVSEAKTKTMETAKWFSVSAWTS